MPGYVIHLAVAEEYLRKHKNKGEEYEEFIKGVIYPDSIVPKSKTHYGKESSLSNVFEFLKVNKINNSFNRGYFLHLLTDYLFYNRYIDHTSKDIYNDYDILNKRLIEIITNLSRRYKTIDKKTNFIIFDRNMLIVLLSIFFSKSLDEEIYIQIASKITLDIVKQQENNSRILDEINCCGLFDLNKNKELNNTFVINKILIGDVNLNVLKGGIVFNSIEQNYNICLSRILSDNI